MTGIRLRVDGNVVLVLTSTGCWKTVLSDSDWPDWFQLEVKEQVAKWPRTGWSWWHNYMLSQSLRRGMKLWAARPASIHSGRYEVGGGKEWRWDIVVRPFGAAEMWLEQVHRTTDLTAGCIVLQHADDIQKLRKVRDLRMKEVRMWMALAVMGGL